jgi:hypothetical protein
MCSLLKTHKKLATVFVVLLIAATTYVLNIEKLKYSSDGTVINAKDALMPVTKDYNYKFSCTPLTYTNLINYQKEWDAYFDSLPDRACCEKEVHLKCVDSEWEVYKDSLCFCIHII